VSKEASANRTIRQGIDRLLDRLIVAGALGTVPVTVLLEEHRAGAFVIALDWCIWIIFAFEFVARCILEPKRLWSKKSVLSVAVVVASFCSGSA
jgi:hypothetical protein